MSLLVLAPTACPALVIIKDFCGVGFARFTVELEFLECGGLHTIAVGIFVVVDVRSLKAMAPCCILRSKFCFLGDCYIGARLRNSLFSS